MEWFYLAFISAILSAIAAVLQKKVLFTFDALEFSFLLALCNAILVLFFINSINFDNISSAALLILYFKTFLGALAFWFVMLAIKNMEISGALPLMVLTPGLVAIFSFLFIGESIVGLEILGMCLLLIGTYILEIKKGDNLLNPIKIFYRSDYHHYIVYAILLFTISSILDKVLLKAYQLPPVSFVFFQQLFLAINFTIILLIKRKNIFKILKSVNRNSLIWIVLISIVTIGYRYTQIEAIKIAPVALVLSIKRTSVFFASIIGGKIFSETLLLKKAIAIIVMLFGAYFLT
ncbi:MAG: EamA family transporter [Melioribacteraceae bacterium]|nr:EamA family transporter [Melioribacteraceae bacterium]